MVEGCSKLDENVEEKAKVDARIQDQEIPTRHGLGVEPKLERDTERVVEGQNDDKKLPLSLPGVVLTDHEPVILVSDSFLQFLSTFPELFHPV